MVFRGACTARERGREARACHGWSEGGGARRPKRCRQAPCNALWVVRASRAGAGGSLVASAAAAVAVRDRVRRVGGGATEKGDWLLAPAPGWCRPLPAQRPAARRQTADGSGRRWQLAGDNRLPAWRRDPGCLAGWRRALLLPGAGGNERG